MTEYEIDRQIEATRTFIDSCMADPEHHLLLSERKPSILAATQAMARGQRALGREHAARYCDDMFRRLAHWQYDDLG